MDNPADCQITLLTPKGRGAIATIAVVGPRSLQLVDQFFKPLGKRSLATAADHAILVGHWRARPGHLEEVVIARRGPSSLEVNCHGGIAASDAVVTSLISAGAVVADPDDWLIQNTKNPVQMAAWKALAAARTERTAAILMDQFRGRLTAQISEIAESISDVDATLSRLDRLIELGNIGLHLTVPWQVAIAGRPNVGKSTLINALLGYERSIVFDEPGTTRDVLTATTALDGWLVELSDTAGYREATDVLEQEGVRRARKQIESADLTVIVLDGTQIPDPSLESLSSATRDSLVVVNKMDLLNPSQPLPDEWLRTSALKGDGISLLAQRITEKLITSVPAPGEGVPFTSEQLGLIRNARDAVASGQSSAAVAHLKKVLHGALTSACNS